MRRFGLTIVLALAAVLAVGTVGCSPRLPSEPPAIEGLITSATASGGRAMLLVEVPAEELPGSESPSRGYDKASVTVSEDTLLFDAAGGTLAITRLSRTGARVRVWFTGPVAESYPVQATASAVQLLD